MRWLLDTNRALQWLFVVFVIVVVIIIIIIIIVQNIGVV
jgi:hypothetical protein